ncbi:MAG: CTP synthase [Saccharofermentanales bacterium]
MAVKYIFVTGGVVSGLGKGITAAALGALLKARGLSVVTQKFDPYVNVDPALMSPTQHGEKFITEDGAETDLDIGHYERFTDINLTAESDITSGQIYQAVIKREREGGYNGGTVQVVPHIINEIKDHMFRISRNEPTDVVIAEIGGTIGDMESTPFIEAIRQVSYRVGRENCLLIHVTLLPYLRNPGEIKTKPTQHSVLTLLSYGVQPDILVCRTEVPLDESIRSKIALYCNVKHENVIENRDVSTVYELPLYFEKQGLAKVVCKQLGIAQFVEPDLSLWQRLNEQIKYTTRKLKIALVGKYVSLQDAYYSVLEAIDHASIENGALPEIIWVDSDPLEEVSESELNATFADVDAMIIPGGFGPRGMEGMIRSAEYARVNNLPFFGIGLGMQMGVVEIARNLADIKDAHTDEFEKPCSDIFYYAGLNDEQTTTLSEIPLPDQPMRLGAYPMQIKENTKLHRIYRSTEASERHHHRREFNLTWQGPLLQTGLVFSATSPDGKWIEAVELPDHPFYIGIISHPEFKSRPIKPHPLFNAFIEAALKYKKSKPSE